MIEGTSTHRSRDSGVLTIHTQLMIVYTTMCLGAAIAAVLWL